MVILVCSHTTYLCSRDYFFLRYASRSAFSLGCGGWNNFSGLSSPVINWFNAYHKPGTVSTGFGTLVCKAEWNETYTSVSLSLEFDKELAGKEVAIIVCLAGGPREIMVKAGKKAVKLKV